MGNQLSNEVVYFYRADEEFQCMTEYVESMSNCANVNYAAYSKLPTGLGEFHEQEHIQKLEKKILKFEDGGTSVVEVPYAIVLGTRRTDPGSYGLDPYTITDGAYPRFLRVHPVLDWTYGEI